MTKVTIIGAGVVGLCVATELAERDTDITVIDRGFSPGSRNCSWWAGGMLAPWCEGESAEEPVVRLGQKAMNWWENNTGQVQRKGSLVVALGRDQTELARFGRRTSNFKEVDSEEISKLEPDLAERFSKGLLFAEEGHLAPRLALQTLKARLVQKGVSFIQEEVLSLHERSFETVNELTIDCRGLAAQDSLPDLRGVKGEMLILSSPDVCLSRPVRLLHPRIPLYIVPRGDGIFMLGATMIETNDRQRITARSMLELLSAAYAINPAFGEAEIVEIGVDARPAFPDNLPRIARRGNFIHVNGLFRHGFLLAPAMARMVAEMIFENKKPELMDENHAEWRG